MNVALEPGKYVAAVSGGVDSVALLHVLKGLPDLDLMVAHFDHGIRENSAGDREFVQQLAENYGLSFTFAEGRLGKGASEATARQARYDFLRKAQHEHDAQAIITAHHQDDVLETAIINLLRGTGRKGLASLTDRPGIERPLLRVSKQEILEYAEAQNLEWREDNTNQDQAYLRNYVRHNITPKLDNEAREQFLAIIRKQQTGNDELDTLLVKQLAAQASIKDIDRQWFSGLPHAVAREVMAAWLRTNGINDFDSKALERLVTAAKTASAGSRFDVLHGKVMKVQKDNLALADKER